MNLDSRNESIGREEFLMALLKLRENDPDAFMQLILESLKRHPELAISDEHSVERKIQALEKMIRHFEEKEEYEECAFIKKLSDQIKDGSEE